MDQDNKIVGMGYNKMPNRKSNRIKAFPWARKGEKNDTKYPYGEFNFDFLGSNMHLFFSIT